MRLLDHRAFRFLRSSVSTIALRSAASLALVLFVVGGMPAPVQADPCTVPDDGSGTVTLPPEGCQYLSPDEVHKIIDGLPPGTTIEFAPIHKDFICGRGADAFPGCPPAPLCEQPGGALGGRTDCFDSTLELHVTGTGALTGLSRVLQIPVLTKVETGPRVPGAAVQTFPTDMANLQGVLPAGDPDFQSLQVTGGTAFGLPSPGQTTLTQLPSGDFAVDSFFDITYQIDYVGAPGGALAGLSGSTTATIRMQSAGPPPDRFGDCPDPGTGTPPLSQVTFGTLDLPPIPADFFFPGSPPFSGPVALQGEPVGPSSGTASTILKRPTVPVAPADPIGTAGTVPIEIVELQLKSASPINVGTTSWDMDVTLSPGPQASGVVNATKTHANGGTFDGQLPVQPKFTFTNTANPADVRVLDTRLDAIPPLVLQANGSWVHTVDPALGLLVDLGTQFYMGVDDLAGVQNVQPITAGTPDGATVIHVICPPKPPPPPDDHVTLDPTSVEFGNGTSIPPIPADFFDPGSLPFTGLVPMGGGGGGGRVSVRLQRAADPVTPLDPVGVNATIPIELVSLDLRSGAPITVSMADGSTVQWALEVRVNRIEMAALAPGTLTAVKTHPNGGNYNATLPLCPDLVFTRVTDGAQRVLDLCGTTGNPLRLTVNGVFVHDVDPALNIAVPPGSVFNTGIEHEDIGVVQKVVPSTAQSSDTPPSVIHTVRPPPLPCPLPTDPAIDPCAALQKTDCGGTADQLCRPRVVEVIPGGAVATMCDCFTPGPGCGPIDIGVGGDTISCPGTCVPPDIPGPCVIFADDGTGAGAVSTGMSSAQTSALGSLFPPGTQFTCACENICTTNTDCDDGDACTVDVCLADGTCQHTPVSCDDGLACTAATCDPTVGCISTPISCDDGDPCTFDACVEPLGCTHTPIAGCCTSDADCDDGDPCTFDVCDPLSLTCTHTPDPNCPCQPNADGSACVPLGCSPIPEEHCLATCVDYDPATGLSKIRKCDCLNFLTPVDCHVDVPASGAAGSVAAVSGPCVVTDNGSGTVTLPPAGCDYLSPDEVHMIIDGLPAGTTLELAPIHTQFICDRAPGSAGFPGCPPDPTICEDTGGTLGGNVDCFNSTLQLTVSSSGPDLPGFTRALSVPVQMQVSTAPRTPGDPVQDFDTEITQLQGEIFGDPDFCTFRVTGGSALGLPSPGHTTLTRRTDGQWNVDSFFDVEYRIEFAGCPGSPLEGMSGTTRATIRMKTGAKPACVGGCPAGLTCNRQEVTNPDGTIGICCSCVAATTEACCKPDGTCAQLPRSDCEALRGKPLGPGSLCQGDLDGDGLDDACQTGECGECGPGAHWIDTPPCPAEDPNQPGRCKSDGSLCLTDAACPGLCTAGGTPCGSDADCVAPDTCALGPPLQVCNKVSWDQDIFTSGALLGIDLDGDCRADTNLRLHGPVAVHKTGPFDDSAQFPGLRPVDLHKDVIDTEIVSLNLTDGAVTLLAGSGLGTLPLNASLGAVAEDPADPTRAVSFFDMLVEVSGGALVSPLYNQTPVRVQSVVNCLPPKTRYLHISGCTPLFTSPIPAAGQVPVANLVAAEHFPLPDCCKPDGTCGPLSPKQCKIQGGTVVAACLGDVNPANGIDDACDPCSPPAIACDPVDTCPGGGVPSSDVGGIPDNFCSPSEPATPRPALATSALCVNSVNFDVLTVDKPFCHTIQPVGNVSSATLEIHLQAGPSLLSCNDSLTLQPLDALPDKWGRRIGTGGLGCTGAPAGLLATPWQSGATATICLDLSALPNADGTFTNLIPSLNATGRLDIRVQDDTGVDYVELKVVECKGACCFSGGACSVTTQSGCESLGGVYAGDGTDCTDADLNGIADVCEPDVCEPTADKTGCVGPCPGTGCFGECINGSYCDNPACCLDPLACLCYAPNSKESIKRCGDCFGECINGAYCDGPDPNCCIVPGACACYLPGSDISIQLCPDNTCFGQCQPDGSYCDGPDPDCCIAGPGNCACYLPSHPFSIKLCQDPTTVPDKCQASCMSYNPVTGLTEVTACDCTGQDECHVSAGPTPPGPTIAAAVGGPCVVPDGPPGTVTLPPAGCDYLSPDEVHMIIDGLPAGTTLELAPIHTQFICDRAPGTAGFPGCPPDPTICEDTGGTLGGNVDCFNSVLQLNVSSTGPGLPGFARALSVPVQMQVSTAPRTPGAPVQDFDTEITQLQGELFGDPDFCTLRVTGGSALGLPSPGHTTLTQRTDGQWNVDSFFDVFYQIEFVGCPGSVLEGMSGTTRATIRMKTGAKPTCVGSCLPGETCVETQTLLPDGTLDICCKCEPAVCEPELDGSACKPTVCPDPTQECIPQLIAVTGTCQLTSVPCKTDADCVGPVPDICVTTSKVLECACDDPNACHVEFDPAVAAAVCVGTCPPGQTCAQFGNDVDGDGTLDQFRCDCVTPPECKPNATGTACEPFVCPNGVDRCEPACVTFDPLTGVKTITDCACTGPGECHATNAGGVAGGAALAVVGGGCVIPEDPPASGTVTLPPVGCDYLSPDEVHLIIDGLPAGTTIELAPIHRDFICNRGGADPGPGCPPPGLCEDDGGSLGGKTDCFDSQLELQMTGTGALTGFNRVVTLPVQTQVHTGPRTPGDPVQSFDTEMFMLQGTLPPGDPDFNLLRVVAGSGNGLPSPGHTTLTQLPSGQFSVDSFFDITYQIEFAGAPGSVLDGLAGTTTATIRMETGGEPRCKGTCPPGKVCIEDRVVNADGTISLCCSCGCPSVKPPNPEATPVEKNRIITIVPDNPGRLTALQVTLKTLPPPYSIWNGKQMWVRNPRSVTELSGADTPLPLPAFTVASLGCTADCRDWGAIGRIDVLGEGVIPGASYAVRAIDCQCDLTDPANFSAALPVNTSIHGDVTRPFLGTWPPPDGSVDIPFDLVALLEKFANLPTAPRKARVDLEPRCLDMKINITDAIRVIDAFRGLGYPETPTSSDPCARLCP